MTGTTAGVPGPAAPLARLQGTATRLGIVLLDAEYALPMFGEPGSCLPARLVLDGICDGYVTISNERRDCPDSSSAAIAALLCSERRNIIALCQNAPPARARSGRPLYDAGVSVGGS